MFNRSAELYDLIYNQMKDYEKESQRVAELLKRDCSGCRTVLDVACGTGEHARFLAEAHGFKVDGVDIESQFVDIAARKLPQGNFVQGDMIDFHMPGRYDAIICLFSAIGYVKSPDNLVRTLENFHRHLNPEGVVIVEPWFTPEQWKPGRPHMLTVDTEDTKVCRMSYSEGDDSLSVIRFEYLVGSRRGIRHFSEFHELGLFTVEQMKEAFRRAGLRVEYDPEGIFGRGLYVATPE